MAVYHDAKSDIFQERADVPDEQTDMRLHTRDELKESLPGFIDLVEWDDYVYQKWMWPDGNFKHKSANIKYHGVGSDC